MPAYLEQGQNQHHQQHILLGHPHQYTREHHWKAQHNHRQREQEQHQEQHILLEQHPGVLYGGFVQKDGGLPWDKNVKNTIFVFFVVDFFYLLGAALLPARPARAPPWSPSPRTAATSTKNILN